MERIGILGGSFDPPHNAHLRMARHALHEIPLHKVLFVPAPCPPHKAPEEMSPYRVRLEMLQLAVAGHPGFEVSRAEEQTEGPSYTVELLKRLRRRRRDEIFLILGADSVADLPAWKNPEEILRMATIVVFPRSGFDPIIPIGGNASVVLFEAPVMDISSTSIRRMIHAGRPVGDVLPKAVYQFILDKSLYT